MVSAVFKLEGCRRVNKCVLEVKCWCVGWIRREKFPYQFSCHPSRALFLIFFRNGYSMRSTFHILWWNVNRRLLLARLCLTPTSQWAKESKIIERQNVMEKRSTSTTRQRQQQWLRNAERKRMKNSLDFHRLSLFGCFFPPSKLIQFRLSSNGKLFLLFLFFFFSHCWFSSFKSQGHSRSFWMSSVEQ